MTLSLSPKIEEGGSEIWVNDNGDGGGWWPVRRRKEKKKESVSRLHRGLERVKGLKKRFVKLPKYPSSRVCTKWYGKKGVYESFPLFLSLPT